MTRNNERPKDIFHEKLISDYMHPYFYHKICGVEDVERVLDKERQIMGLDAILKYKGKEYRIDEKAATDYLNGLLRTFFLEWTFINANGIEMCGWLSNKMLSNNYYAFIWPRSIKNDTLNSIDDIELIEICIVAKSKIIDYLNSIGLTEEVLNEYNKDIRQNPNKEIGDLKKNGYKVTMANKPERSIGVVLPISTYQRLAEIHYFVSPETLTRIKS